MENITNQSRRDFLKTLTYVGAGVYMSNTTLAASSHIAEEESATATISNTEQSDYTTGYKALVNVFLHGGHDGMHMLVPTEDDQYAQYTQTRGNLALAKRKLNIVSADINDENSLKFGINKGLPNIHNMYNNGDLAFISNVGNLTQNAPNLFAHNIQRINWYKCNTQSDINTGWAGRLADKMTPLSEQVYNIGIGKNSLWQRGNSSRGFTLSDSKELSINGLKNDEINKSRLEDLLSTSNSNPYINEYANLQLSNLNNYTIYNDIMDANADLGNSFNNVKNGLAAGLKKIAKIIEYNSNEENATNINRQTFYIELKGFDTHTRQEEKLGKLYEQLDTALIKFKDALVHIEQFNNVTTYIASDFGRAATSNGTGTAHGWASNYFAFGGSVNGGKIYGTVPKLAKADLIRKGRIVPDTSIEQYVSTLTKWFGASLDDRQDLFPDLVNYTQDDLGFMNNINITPADSFIDDGTTTDVSLYM